MTAYLIVYGATPADRLAAHAFSTRAAAHAASLPDSPFAIGRLPEPNPHGFGGCHYVIETEADVTFGGRLLVEVYNGLTGGSVKRFEDRAAGVRRLMEALPKVADSVVESEPVQEKPRRDHRHVDGQMTLVEQMAHYNTLVDEALGKGLKFRHLGVRGSHFATRAAGNAAIAKIRAALDQIAT